MPGSLKIEKEEHEPVVVLALQGRLDAASTSFLEEKLYPYLNRKEAKVILDFHELIYLSSAGMRLLLSATKKIRSFQGDLVFCSINEEVMEIIKMAGFEKILKIYGKKEEALAALK